MARAFVFGLSGAGLICLLAALYRSFYFASGIMGFRANVLYGRDFMESVLYGGNHFFGQHLSVFHQTIYFALYLCSGIVLLLFFEKLFKKSVTILLLSFFIGLVFLISNKAAFVVLGIIFFIRLFFLPVSFIKKAVGLTSVLLTMALMLYLNPRARESVQKLVAGDLVINKNTRYGAALRLLSWDTAVHLVKANPVWGYGSGDTQAELDEAYSKKQYKEPLKQHLNAHNQWLQLWLENGMLGLFSLVMVFILLFKVSVGYSTHLGLAFTLVTVLLINTFFESIFNRFSGVSFFAFVSCLILTISNQEENKR